MRRKLPASVFRFASWSFWSTAQQNAEDGFVRAATINKDLLFSRCWIVQAALKCSYIIDYLKPISCVVCFAWILHIVSLDSCLVRLWIGKINMNGDRYLTQCTLHTDQPTVPRTALLHSSVLNSTLVPYLINVNTFTPSYIISFGTPRPWYLAETVPPWNGKT